MQVRRGDVIEAAGRLLKPKGARLVNFPRTGQSIGIGEPDELARMMREIQVIPPERPLDPRRHTDQRRAIDVVTDRRAGHLGEDRVLRQPHRANTGAGERDKRERPQCAHPIYE